MLALIICLALAWLVWILVASNQRAALLRHRAEMEREEAEERKREEEEAPARRRKAETEKAKAERAKVWEAEARETTARDKAARDKAEDKRRVMTIRDFLIAGDEYLGCPTPLVEMVKQDRQRVVKILIDFLSDGDIMQRKYAAFCLGQIGDQSAIPALRAQLPSDAKIGFNGFHDAALSAWAALARKPADRGFSELERREVIEDVYNKRAAIPTPWE